MNSGDGFTEKVERGRVCDSVMLSNPAFKLGEDPFGWIGKGRKEVECEVLVRRRCSKTEKSLELFFHELQLNHPCSVLIDGIHCNGNGRIHNV